MASAEFEHVVSLAVTASIDARNAQHKIVLLEADNRALEVAKDKLSRERDNLLTEVLGFRAGLRPLNTLYEVAQRAQRTLSLLAQTAHRRSVKPGTCAAYAVQLEKALIEAEPHVDTIPF